MGEFLGVSVKSCGRALLLFWAAASLPVRTQQSGQGTLLLRIDPECSITWSASTLSGRRDSGAFGGVTTFRYKLRTSKGGTAAIQLKLDRPGARFDYVVRLPGARESSGGQIIPESSSITVARFGPNSHSSKEGDTGTITWTLQDTADVGPPPIVLTIRCN